MRLDRRRSGLTGMLAAALLALPWLLALDGCESGSCGVGGAPEPTERQLVLLDTTSTRFRTVPPDTFDVLFRTSRGEFTITVLRDWAPMGVYRFYNLVRNGFYDGNVFFRVVPGYIAQFGASSIPAIEAVWNTRTIPDDPVRVSNVRGTVTFAKSDENSRATQLFINTRDNSQLDADGFAPIGFISNGMRVVNRLYGGYGDIPPQGDGPHYTCIVAKGSAYLNHFYPRLDSIIDTRIVREAG